MTNKKQTFKLKKKDQQFLIAAFIFCVGASFVTIIVLRVVYPHKSSQDIGTTVSGILGTFFSFFGSMLVFMALRSQIKANKIISEQFKIQQFESQFYEMLRLHKENVNEVSIAEVKYTSTSMLNSQSNLTASTGRKAFEDLLFEFEKCYYAARAAYVLEEKEFWINKAYKVFFFGIESNENNFERNTIVDGVTIVGKDELFYNKLKDAFWTSRKEFLKGNVTYLAHIYRHLFQMVKFVSNQKEDFLSFEMKRKYLRILRAQLSNPEQALLFYNWLSGFGSSWENETNKFFTDYRMIHNIYDSMLIEDIKLHELFNLYGNFRKEKDREYDPLFEFQDWT